DAGYDVAAAEFTRGWQAWTAGLALPAPDRLPAGPGLAHAPRNSAGGLRGPGRPTGHGAVGARAALPRGGRRSAPGRRPPRGVPGATTWCGAGTAGRPRWRWPPPGTSTTPPTASPP